MERVLNDERIRNQLWIDNALKELKETGEYKVINNETYVQRRQEIEDIIGLDEMYKIEEETVENK